MHSPTRKPPRKQPGQGRGPRRIDGVALDVRGGSAFFGCSEKTMRGLIERRLIPFRRLSGRIILIREELETFLLTLDGCGLDEAKRNMATRRGDSQ